MSIIRNYKYKHTTLLFLSLLFTIFLSGTDLIGRLFFNLKDIEIIGPFITGMLYVSTITAPIGILILSNLAKTLSPIKIAAIAGLGSAFADFVIFRFFKDSIVAEIAPIYNRLGGQYLTRILYHRYCIWSLPIIGAIIIASPFPDEIGVGLMGLSKIKNYQFILLCFVLNAVGMFLLASTFSSID